MFQKTKKLIRKTLSAKKMQMLMLMLLCGVTSVMAQNSAGDYSAGTTALATVTEEINFRVNPTKYNTCIKSYLLNNNTLYTMNYSVKVNYNNT